MLAVFILWILGICAAIISMIFLKDRITKNVILACGILAAAMGLFFYGYGYYYVSDSKGVGAIKTVFAVIKLFFGGNAYDDISVAPLFSYHIVQIAFWLLHFAGTFSTASVALAAFGKTLLRRLRLRVDRFSDLSIIYGLTVATLRFGKQLAVQTTGHVIFVGDTSEIEEESLADTHCHLRSDSMALSGDPAFLRSIGAHRGNRRIHLYCLADDHFSARIYAEKVLNSLETLNISPQRTALTLHTPEQLTFTSLQASDGHYGYGSVDLLDVPDLVSRMLIQKFPPFEQLSFLPNGLATTDFHCVIVGFGALGQAILRGLIMNGQFEGSHFRADIFDPSCKQRLGKFKFLHPALFSNYDICLHETDGRSEEFYSFFRENSAHIRYIVLCGGTEERNDYLAREILPCIRRSGSHTELCLCDRRSVKGILPDGSIQSYPIYDYSVLCTDSLDRRAIALNACYCSGSNLTPEEEWTRCDFFSRASSRASADFAEAFARVGGIERRVTDTVSWEPSPELLENLAKTEHLRWCAFHYASGFVPMDEETFQLRCRQYAQEVRNYGKGTIRPGKDLHKRTHVCLTLWDNLDRLSQLEKQLAGRDVDYKQMDRNNVLLTPALLKIDKG